MRRFYSTTSIKRRLYDSILDTIGRTPIVRINNVAPKHVTMYAKCEFFNPLSSVKDRLALAVIEDAEKSGKLKPGMTVCEATSGNTGIALAMVCAQKGYPCVLTMAETFSIERRRIMRALGAKVILTPAKDKGVGMVKKARQFENEANSRFHAETTGAEILSDFGGKRLDYFVLGTGTGGTFAGAGASLKAARPELNIILAEPSNAALISSGIEQTRLDDNSPAATHPSFNPHPIQGWTPDFIPKLAQNGVDQKFHSDIVTVTPDEAIEGARQLAKSEGIFSGTSGGASFKAAVKVAENAPEGSVFLVMIADTGERYFTSPLWNNIEADMNEEELELSKSTPNFQLEGSN